MLLGVQPTSRDHPDSSKVTQRVGFAPSDDCRSSPEGVRRSGHAESNGQPPLCPIVGRFTSRSAPIWPERRRHRCRRHSPRSQSWCALAAAERLSGCRCVGRSTSPRYGAANAFRDGLPPALRLQAAHGAVLPAGSGAARLLHRTIAVLQDMTGELSMAEKMSAIGDHDRRRHAGMDGSIATSSGITVNSGGTLSGIGTVPGTQVASGGTLSPRTPSNPIGTLTITGNLAFQSGALYVVYLNPTTSSFATVTGTASLAGAVNANFAAGSYAAKQYRSWRRPAGWAARRSPGSRPLACRISTPA